MIDYITFLEFRYNWKNSNFSLKSFKIPHMFQKKNPKYEMWKYEMCLLHVSIVWKLVTFIDKMQSNL